MDILFLWYGEDATEIEKLAWKGFCSSEALKDAEFLAVERRDQVKTEDERLTKEGWTFQGLGSGSYARISSYSKSKT